MCGRKWDLFGHFFFWLLKGKLTVITAAKIPLIAALLVLGSTGFVVTGTIQGDEDDRMVNLIFQPLESKTCIDALIAQTGALLELDMLAADAQQQLQRMRDRARESADDQHKIIDETALRAQFQTSSNLMRDELTAARHQILDTDLGNCQDGDPDSGITLDVAELRRTYDRMLRDFGAKLNAVLDEAQSAFDVLVANAQPKPPEQDSNSNDGSDSHSRD
jgi:hypothetical protein